MNKVAYLALAFSVSTLLFSCKSKKMNLKDGATIVNTNDKTYGTAGSSNVIETNRGLMMTIDSDLLFPTNSSYLTDKAKSALNGFVSMVKQHPEANIQVDGHTDATGEADYNQWLSEKRAVSVKVYLESAGVSGSRIETSGYGQTNPVADNKTKEGRQKNRRVEITILK